MDKIRKIVCNDAPSAIGPYSQAVSAGPFVFVSGQIPLDPRTGNIVDEGIREQSSAVIENAEKILRSEGLSLDAVVKTEVFLSDLRDYEEMNEIYSAKFNGKVKPARVVVEVSKLPRGVRIELSCVAYRE